MLSDAIFSGVIFSDAVFSGAMRSDVIFSGDNHKRGTGNLIAGDSKSYGIVALQMTMTGIVWWSCLSGNADSYGVPELLWSESYFT